MSRASTAVMSRMLDAVTADPWGDYEPYQPAPDVPTLRRYLTDPAYRQQLHAERDTFYADRAEDHRRFIAAKDTREAMETIALELLAPAASDAAPASLNPAPAFEAGRCTIGDML